MRWSERAAGCTSLPGWRVGDQFAGRRVLSHENSDFDHYGQLGEPGPGDLIALNASRVSTAPALASMGRKVDIPLFDR